MKNLQFVLTWYISAILALAFSLLLLINVSHPRQQENSTTAYQVYKALPNISVLSQQESIDKADGRATIIAEFFKQNRSPLANFADQFVKVADFYQLDYRLLPAISMQESNGGKKIPNNSYNPFGFGIYGGQILKFNSFEEGIEKVGKSLRRDYLDKGLKTPGQIMTKYTPPAVETGSWALGVSAFMEQLR